MTAILGIGTDLVNIVRFRQRIESPSFRARVFTETELVEAKECGDLAMVLATKFACKEAVMKCLGAGLRQGVWFSQISVTRQDGIGLHVTLSRHACDIADDLGPCYWQLSSTNRGAYLFAQALLITGRSPSGDALPLPRGHTSMTGHMFAVK